MTALEFYKANREEILKIVGSEHFKDKTLGQYKYEFTAHSGLRYYSIPESVAVPLKRYAKILEYNDWIENGINAKELGSIYNQLLDCHAQIRVGNDVKKYNTDAGVLLNELILRQRMAFPYNVFQNLIAVALIREDEDPYIISPEIHKQKCDEIEFEIDSGKADFFLNIPQLKQYSTILNLSSEERLQFLVDCRKNSEKEIERTKALFTFLKERQPVKTTLSNPS